MSEFWVKMWEWWPEVFPVLVYATGMTIRVAVGALILEASRRVDHWVLIRKFIPSDSAYYVARENASYPTDVEDPELAVVIEAWPRLDENIRKAIVQLSK